MKVTVQSANGKACQVELIDDYGGFDSGLYVIGHEFGPTHLVTADGESAAMDAWLDEQDTIPESELWEAYGYDSAELYDRAMENNESCPELDEAYQYQANFTGTGIVNVGHYQWMSKATPLFTY